MAGLSTKSQDSLFLFGIGVSAIAVLQLMRRMLVIYRDSAVLPPSENKPQYITQDVEDSLRHNTLDKLLDSPNYCIQETTAIIVCERALHDDKSLISLMWYITRPQHAEREKGIRALTMLMNHSTIHMINNPSTYAALVKCLQYCLDDYPHHPYDEECEWDSWSLRDVVEQGCLLILTQLLDVCGDEAARTLIKAGFIEKWLAKEPWGDSEKTRRANFATSLRRDYKLGHLYGHFRRNREGQTRLSKVGLMDPKYIEEPDEDIRMVNGEGTAGEDFEAMFVERRRRSFSTPADENLRRRHREAMVLRDGIDTRPLERGDIIQRET